MKSLNSNENLWSEMSVDVLESREEYAICLSKCFQFCYYKGCFTD